MAIVRAIAIKPRFLIFDEPTSALDPEMTAEVLDFIAELRAEGRNLIIVTHNMGFAREVCTRSWRNPRRAALRWNPRRCGVDAVSYTHLDVYKRQKVDNANVVTTDVMASNGVIHVIDTVLMPK